MLRWIWHQITQKRCPPYWFHCWHPEGVTREVVGKRRNHDLVRIYWDKRCCTCEMRDREPIG